MNRKKLVKMGKRLLAIVCAAAMLSNGYSVRVDAHYWTDVKYMKIPSLSFELLDDDKVSLVKYRKEANQEPYVLGIPGGINVTERDNIQKLVGIEDNVFINESFSMIYVEINNGVSIGKSAFNKVSVDYANPYVTDMDVNFIGGKDKGTITGIGESAFAYFYVPGGYVYIDNVTGTIGAHAFEKASILEDFVIAAGLIDEIGEYAFRSFHASRFKITDYIKMDEGAFSRANFKTFKLSDKVEYIGSKIFEGCDELEEITLPAEDHIKEVASDAFPDREGLCINIPAGYEDLSSYHFDQYQNLSYCLSPEYTTESKVYQQLAATGADIVFKQFTPATTTTMESIKPTNPATQSSSPATTQSPAASKTPDAATQTPEVTKSPEATQTPEVTKNSEVMQSPKVTKSPAVTQSPEVPQTPEVTKSPAATQSPEVPQTPEVTKNSAATQSPAVTQSPEAIKTPETAAKTPEVMNPPAAVTQKPEATQTPAASTNKNKKKTVSKKAPSVGTTLIRKGIRYRITGKNTASCIGAVKGRKKITIASNITCGGSSYRVTMLSARAFYKDRTLENVRLGKYMETIKNSALEQCTQLKKVTFGKNLTTIEKRAFYKDKKLVRLIFEGEKLRKVGKQAFSKGKKTKKVIVPSYVNQKKYYVLLQGSIVD